MEWEDGMEGKGGIYNLDESLGVVDGGGVDLVRNAEDLLAERVVVAIALAALYIC